MAGEAPDSDPTLAALVPRRSVGRNLLLAAVALVVLVGAWASPPLLRTSITGGPTEASWAPVGPNQVVTETSLSPQGWPSVEVRSVDGVAGARLLGAWVLTGDAMTSRNYVAPADFGTGLDYLRSSYPHADLGTTQLPRRLTPGQPSSLVTLWEIVDCAQLVEGEQPSVSLRSALGASTSERLTEWAGPAAHLPTLVDAGTCPAR